MVSGKQGTQEPNDRGRPISGVQSVLLVSFFLLWLLCHLDTEMLIACAL